MKSKIVEADLQAARTVLRKQRRKKTVISTGKTLTTFGSVAAGVIGIAVLARVTKPKSGRTGK